MDPKIFLRFDEAVATRRPIDDGGALTELDVVAGIVMPTVVDGVTGKARSFGGAAGTHGLVATDRVSGTTLFNRDVSVRALITYDVALAVGGAPATLIARGKGNSAAEYHPFALEIRLINTPSLIGEVAWLWQDGAGVEKSQIGGHFQAPASGFVLLTATRRWVSSTEVILRYYAGDELLAEVPSVDGSIGGGTTGQMAIGTRYSGGAYTYFYGGKIDQLQVYDRELTAEEVRGTYERIVYHQPRAISMVRELHPPGFPISGDPTSRVQRETIIWGNALGYAAAQAENVRDNVLPDRAYGEVLEAWERITAQSPKPGDAIDDRRARVVARMRQRQGVSVPGIKAALEGLIDTDPDNLEILGFDQTVTDSFATLSDLRWWMEPSAQWTLAAGAMRGQAAAGTYTYEARTWYTALESIGGDGKGVHELAKLVIAALPANGQAGIVLYDSPRGSVLFLGVRNNAGTYEVVTEAFRASVSQGVTVQASLGGSPPAAIWLHLRQVVDAAAPELQEFRAAWSTTSQTTGYTVSTAITHPWRSQWAGMYLRTAGAIGSAIDVAFDDSIVRAPYGDRASWLYVYRNPALAGTLDKEAANAILRGLKQAHTAGAVISAKAALCDDPLCLCDEEPLGGI